MSGGILVILFDTLYRIFIKHINNVHMCRHKPVDFLRKRSDFRLCRHEPGFDIRFLLNKLFYGIALLFLSTTSGHHF